MALFVGSVAGQTRTLTACTPDAFAVCTELQFGSVAGGSFQLGVRIIGSTTSPLTPVATYNVVLGTGANAAATAQSTLLPPTPRGGAVANDLSDWEIFDTGDLLFLSALSNRGVGGCASGTDSDGFGQSVVTCGVGQFATFRFVPTALLDVRQFQLLDLQAVALTTPAEGVSCSAGVNDCLIVADVLTSTPEPTTLVLVGAAFGLVAPFARRRRLLRDLRAD